MASRPSGSWGCYAWLRQRWSHRWRRRERVLVLVSIARAIATGAPAALVVVDGPAPIIYALAVLSSVAVLLYRPAHSALFPSLCRTGYELASANVVRGLLDSVATLVGPLLAAVVLQFTNVAVVFAVASAASLWAAGLMLRVRYDAPPRPSAAKRRHLMAEAAEDIRAGHTQPGPGTSCRPRCDAEIHPRSADGFTVVVALELLGTGEPGVGTLTAAVGAGAVLG